MKRVSRIAVIALATAFAAAVPARAQVPADLRAAMEGRARGASREHNTQHGSVVITRFFSGGLWVIEVWTKESDAWMVLASQVTTAKP